MQDEDVAYLVVCYLNNKVTYNCCEYADKHFTVVCYLNNKVIYNFFEKRS